MNDYWPPNYLSTQEKNKGHLILKYDNATMPDQLTTFAAVLIARETPDPIRGGHVHGGQIEKDLGQH